MRPRWVLFVSLGVGACSGYSSQQLLDGAFIDTRTQVAATLLSPAHNAGMTIDTQFTWTGAGDARQYQLEISANPDLSAPVLKATTKATQYVIRTADLVGVSALTEQVYYWRITTVYGTKSERSAAFTMILYDKDIAYVNGASTNSQELGNLTAPYKTIQPAVDFAFQNAKKKVYVAQGTYNAAIALAAGVSLQGGYNATGGWSRSIAGNPTVISIAAGLIAVSTPPGATSATAVDGFTIQNNTSTGLSSTGVYIAGGSPTISNNTISAGGSSFNYGIYLNNNASPLIAGNSIYGGNGLTGSRGIYSLASSPQIYNNVISGGAAGNTNIGVYTDNSTAKISNNTIHAGANAAATTYGVYLSVAGDAATITNNIIFCTTGGTLYGIYKNNAGAEPVSVQNNNVAGCTDALYQNGATSYNFVCTTTGNFHQNTCGGAALSVPTGSGNVSIGIAGMFASQNGPDTNIATMNDNDWRLTTLGTICNVRGGGLTIAGITLDKDGVTRTATTPLSGPCTPTNTGFTGWSMGAYESN